MVGVRLTIMDQIYLYLEIADTYASKESVDEDPDNRASDPEPVKDYLQEWRYFVDL